MSVTKEVLVKRVQEISTALENAKKELEQQIANLNMLDGQRREALHVLYLVENPPQEPVEPPQPPAELVPDDAA